MVLTLASCLLCLQHTSWNCLVSRTVDGVQPVPGPFRVNGKTLPELLKPAPAPATIAV